MCHSFLETCLLSRSSCSKYLANSWEFSSPQGELKLKLWKWSSAVSGESGWVSLVSSLEIGPWQNLLWAYWMSHAIAYYVICSWSQPVISYILTAPCYVVHFVLFCCLHCEMYTSFAQKIGKVLILSMMLWGHWGQHRLSLPDAFISAQSLPYEMKLH